MYRTAVIRKQALTGRTGHRRKEEVSCFALKGFILENDRQRSIHYPAYYTATCQNENITSHSLSLYDSFVTSIRSGD